MSTIHPAALAARRKYWTRPDAYRFAPPGTPEAKMPGWLDPSATRVRLKEAQEEEARAHARELRRRVRARARAAALGGQEAQARTRAVAPRGRNTARTSRVTNWGGGRAARAVSGTQQRRTRKMSLVPARSSAMPVRIRSGPVINSRTSFGFACWVRARFPPTRMATNVGGLTTFAPMVLRSGGLERAERFGDSGLIRVDLQCNESFGVINRFSWQVFSDDRCTRT